MRAHDTVNVITVLSENIQKTRRKSPLAMALMDNQLRHPTHIPAINSPTARKSMTSKNIIDCDSDVRAVRAVVGETLSSQAFYAKLYWRTCPCLVKPYNIIFKGRVIPGFPQR